MSYTFTIGEAEQYIPGEGEESLRQIIVQRIILPDAPVFPNDTMTENSNQRSPADEVWYNFCKEANIFAIFYDYNGKLKNGYIHVTRVDLEVIRNTLNVRRLNTKFPPGFDLEPVPQHHDGVLARLIWLEFWMNWALENCKNPVIAIM